MGKNMENMELLSRLARNYLLIIIWAEMINGFPLIWNLRIPVFHTQI